MNILNLRPTQFVLGMKDVDFKVGTIKSLKGEPLAKYFRDHPIPLIKGPNGSSFMIDRHHLARACWQLGSNDFQCFIKADLSQLSVVEFWQEMGRNKWTYLFDHTGVERLADDLPRDVSLMVDDPYRSLAWAVAREGGFKKLLIPFLEFQWAAFYRKDPELARLLAVDFASAVAYAKKLSRADAAKDLPGYLGGVR